MIWEQAFLFAEEAKSRAIAAGRLPKNRHCEERSMPLNSAFPLSWGSQ